MKGTRVIMGCLIMIVLSGCAAVHYGQMMSPTVLNAPNFSYVHTNVEGEASVSYVLIFGGMEKATLVGEAKRDLLEEYPLQENQALANQTINFRVTFLFLGLLRKMTSVITADVVEFKHQESSNK